MYRFIHHSICILICFSTTYAQSNLKDFFSKYSQLGGRFGPESVNWIDGGNAFSYKAEDGDILIYHPSTTTTERLLDLENVYFPGTNKLFEYSSFEWSQDNQFIVFRTNERPVWRNSGIADYYLFSRETKNLSFIAPDIYTGQLSPDGKQFAYESNGNLFVMQLKNGKERQLTFDSIQSVYNGRFGWAYEEEWGLVQAWSWSHNSKQIAFWQTDERKVPIYHYTNYSGFDDKYKSIPYPRVGDPDPIVKVGVIHLVDNSIQWMQVDGGDDYIPRIYWTADTNQLAIVHVNRQQNHMQLFFANILTGNKRLVFQEKSDTWVEVFSFGADILHFFTFPKNKEEFLWKSERNGRSHIYQYNYDGKLINQITKGEWEVIKIEFADFDNQKLYYTSTEVSPLEKHLYSVQFDGNNKKQLTKVEGVHAIQFGGPYYLDSYSNIHLPKQVNLSDNSGNFIHNFEDNDEVSDFIKINTYVKPQLMQFKTEDGQLLDIAVLKPNKLKKKTKYPVLLSVYGGPEHQAVFNEFATNPFDQYLVEQGYIVVYVNNRGGSSYGSDFKTCVYEQLGKWECHDFAQAATYVSTMPWADKDRIGIYGHSYGGFSAAYSIMEYPELYKTAIIAAPVTDWRNYDAIYTERFMGLLPQNKVKYDKASILSRVSKLNDKVLIAHSAYDDNVHVKNTMQLLTALIDQGKDAELKLYTSGGHGIANSYQSYILLLQQYVDFLKKNL